MSTPSRCSTHATATRVLGLATRVVRDRAQAEEVTQEVFLEIWRESGRYVATLRHRETRRLSRGVGQVNLSSERAADPTVAFAAEE